MRRLVVVLAGVTVLVAGGCGNRADDLFEVERSGSIPGAELRIVVSDDGTVRCNGAAPKHMGDPRLLTARTLQRELEDRARGNKRLRRGTRSVLSYVVRLPSGTLTYSDSSVGQSQAMQQLQGFTRDVAQHVCGFAR